MSQSGGFRHQLHPVRRSVRPAGRGPAALAREPARLIELYRGMVLTRRFDAKAIALQRTGRLGTYASSLGQEAVSVGLAHAMRAEDVLLPSYRETGAQICRGVSLVELLLYWGGDERGSDFAGPRADFPVAVPIASQCLHATGVAYAFKLRREPRVAVCVCGDGATSNGAFYEAINTAGAWRVPAVFVICNNQWAISMPRSAQTATATLAQKAIAAGIPGEQVDGNDVIAVRHLVGHAVERARSGEGACVVEAVTYRMSDHTTADDATRYRDGESVSAAVGQGPDRAAAHLPERGRPLDQGRRGAPDRRGQPGDRGRGRAVSRDPAATPRIDVRPSLRRAAAGAGEAAAGRGGRERGRRSWLRPRWSAR